MKKYLNLILRPEIGLVIFIIIAIGWLVLNPNFGRLLELRRMRRQLRQELELIYRQNFDLKNQLYAVQYNPSEIERIARRQGMTKPGELVFYFGNYKENK
mgnify:CR=1 FL=1